MSEDAGINAERLEKLAYGGEQLKPQEQAHSPAPAGSTAGERLKTANMRLRIRLADLEQGALAFRSRPDPNTETIEYLIKSAETLMASAKLLIEMREPPNSQAQRPPEL